MQGPALISEACTCTVLHRGMSASIGKFDRHLHITLDAVLPKADADEKAEHTRGTKRAHEQSSKAATGGSASGSCGSGSPGGSSSASSANSASSPAMRRIHMQVMWQRLIAVVEEQAQALLRTAFSPIVRECGDLSAGE